MSSRLTPSHELPLRADISEAGQSNAGCAPPHFGTARTCTPFGRRPPFTCSVQVFQAIPEAYRIASVRASKAPQEILGHPRGPLFLIPCTSCLPVPAAHKDGGGNLGGGLTLTPADFGRGCMMRVISGKLMISSKQPPNGLPAEVDYTPSRVLSASSWENSWSAASIEQMTLLTHPRVHS